MTRTLAVVSLVGLLSYGCATEPKKILQTGVNESLPHSDVAINRVDADKRRKEDLEPYAGLSIQGPLQKSEVIRSVQRNRKRIEQCYRRVIGDAPAQRSSSGPRPEYEPKDNQYDRSNSSMKPDGMLDSTSYSTPRYDSLPTRSGEVVLNFTVGSDGKVREARTSLSDFSGSYIRVCLEEAVSSFQFSPGNAESKVRYLALRFSNETTLLK